MESTLRYLQSLQETFCFVLSFYSNGFLVIVNHILYLFKWMPTPNRSLPHLEARRGKLSQLENRYQVSNWGQVMPRFSVPPTQSVTHMYVYLAAALV